MDVQEEDVGEDEDVEVLIHHASGDQQEDSTVGHAGHPATTAVADVEEKRKDIRTLQPQKISWEAPHTRLHDIIVIVK